MKQPVSNVMRMKAREREKKKRERETEKGKKKQEIYGENGFQSVI